MSESDPYPCPPSTLLLGTPTPVRGTVPFHLRCFTFPSGVWSLLAASKLFTSWAGRFSWRPRSLGLGSGQQVHGGPADLTASWQISFLGGLALNEGVNWLIKHVIQEPRPCGGRARAAGVWGSPRSGHYREACILPSCPILSPPDPHMTVGTKYGMPSSHSQFMWFFSVYSFLFLYLR